MSKTEIPSIRFRGFDDAWEQRKFGEIASKYEDPVPTPHDGYYRLGIRSHAKGTFPVSYTHLRAHETGRNLVCRLLLEKKKRKSR